MSKDIPHASHFRGPILANGAYVNDDRLKAMIRNMPSEHMLAMAERCQVIHPQRIGQQGGVANPFLDGMFEVVGTGAGSPGAEGNRSDGLYHLDAGSADNGSIDIQAPRLFLPAANKPISFHARLAIEDIDTTEFLCGIHNLITTAWSSGAEAVDDFIGFHRTAADDAGQISFGVWASGANTNSVETITLPTDLADGTLFDLGFVVHGVGVGSVVEVFVAPAVGKKGSAAAYSRFVVSTTQLALLTAAALVNPMGLHQSAAAAGTGGTAGILGQAACCIQPY